jgi:hypothetical protein
MDAEQYTHLVNRRMQWDQLVWQTPTMALTGEAFLFNICLANGVSHFARVVASTLALVVSIASLHTLAMHRTSELADARLIRQYESDEGRFSAHGPDWRDYRTAYAREQEQSGGRREVTDRLVARFARVRGIEVWFWTLALIFVISLILLVMAIFWPAVL